MSRIFLLSLCLSALALGAAGCSPGDPSRSATDESSRSAESTDEASATPDEPEVDLAELQELAEEFFGKGSGSSPTMGMDCWGERLDPCLAVNPELDAIAEDPAVCEGPEARVCLVPIGNVRKDVVDAIVAFHAQTAGIAIHVLPSMPLDRKFVNVEQSQAPSELLYTAMRAKYGITDATPSTYIGIAPIDVAPNDGSYGWWFGSRHGATRSTLNHGVFSYFRMANVPPDSDEPLTDDLLFERASKYMGRYVALLHLDFSPGKDIDFLNYADMWGFSDLDEMGTQWPTGTPACERPEPVICIVPDNSYEDALFEEDLVDAVERLNAQLSIPVEIRFLAGTASYYPTKPSWSEEFAADLRASFGHYLARQNVALIGLTDDELSQSSEVPPHVDHVWPAERLAVASGANAGVPGSGEHEDRLYRVLLRTVLQVQYGMPLTDDPASLLYQGVTEPVDLEGTEIPALP